MTPDQEAFVARVVARLRRTFAENYLEALVEALTAEVEATLVDVRGDGPQEALRIALNEHKTMSETLTAVQARCTELRQELESYRTFHRDVAARSQQCGEQFCAGARVEKP
jgi:hypothetical protein